MAIFSAFSRKFQVPLSFISFIFGFVIDILDTVSAQNQQFELDLPYRRQTRSVSGHLTTPNLSSSFSAAEMTKKIFPIMKSEDLPTISNSTDHACIICLSEYESNEEIRRLILCNHTFHRRCLDSWIDYDHRLICPMCRTALI
ncbi:hypothetical protein MKX03_037134 [Papaver bracteatum]|nr:hypothetical protein MKX03_037134 [Papaver bracteatum]